MTRVLAALLAVLLVPTVAGAVNTKISDRPSAGAITGAEVIGVIQGGVDKKTTVAAIGGAGASSFPASVTMDSYGTTDLCQATTGAIDSIGVTPKILIIDRAVTCTTDKTAPRTLTLKFVPGGLVTVSTTKVLTINGALEAAETQQIFDLVGTGLVKFGRSNVSTLHPQWWTSKTLGDGTGDDSVAINAALVAAEDSWPNYKSGIVQLGSGVFLIESPLLIKKSVTLQGLGRGVSQIQVATDINAIVVEGDAVSGGYVFRSNLRDFDVKRTAAGSASNYYIYMHKTYQCTLERLFLYNTEGNGIYISSSNQVVLTDVNVEGIPTIPGLGTGLTVNNASVTSYGMIIEFFDIGAYLTTGISFSGVSMFGTRFEHITGTYAIFDDIQGATFFGPHMQNGQGTGVPAPVGFSFINGSHHNSIFGGNVAGTSDWGFEPPFQNDATSYQNGTYGSQIYLPNGTLPDAGTVLNGSAPVKIVTYAGTMTFDTKVAEWFDITATSNANRTIAAPTNVSSHGTHLYVTVRNTSGGALGTWTWNAAFHMPTWVKPADGFHSTDHFMYNAVGAYWEHISRSADLAN